MKILYIPMESTNLGTDGFYKALEKKHEINSLWEVGYDKMHRKRFDLVYFQSGAIRPSEIMIMREQDKCIITQWTGDYRLEPLEMVIQYKGLTDIDFMAADVPELYPDMNIKFLPHGVDDWQFRPVNKEAKGVVMVARDYPQFPGGQERRKLIEEIPELDVYGFDKGLDWYDAPDVYNSYKFAVGCSGTKYL
jgi:hypothetical protein